MYLNIDITTSSSEGDQTVARLRVSDAIQDVLTSADMVKDGRYLQ